MSQQEDGNPGMVIPKPLRQAQKMANLLDASIRLPIINIKLGLDFLIGLVPGLGDVVSALIALRIVWLGKKLGVPGAMLVRMLINIGVDMLLGLMPVLGDLIDIFFKANIRNVRMMESWWLSENKAAIDKQGADALAQWARQQQD